MGPQDANQDSRTTRIVTKNFGVANSHRLSTYLQRGGWDLSLIHI